MLTGRDIICFSSIDWDFNWQGHQEIMQRLAAAGNRVLYVENTGVRSPRPSDLGRLRSRLSNWWHSYRGFRRQAENLYVFSPMVLPFPHSRLARWINRRLMSSVLNSWFRSQKFSDPLIWTFLPSRLTLEVIESIPHKLLIYYCIDSFRHSSPAAGRIEASERDMIRRADLVLVTSEQLADHCREHNEDVHKFPFTVDYATFEAARENPAMTVPVDLEALPGPKAGYIGGLHRWMDTALLAGLAEKLPDVQFVLIGPEQEPMDNIRNLPNVHLLGAREHEQLPGYLKGFDIGLIPYLVTDYTQCVHPTKLNEYLSMGLPVLSTPIREMVSFDSDNPGLVDIGHNAAELSGLLGRRLESLSGDTESELRSQRIELARECGWQNRLEMMCELIEQRINEVRPCDESGWLERLTAVSRGGRRRVLVALVTAAIFWILLFAAPSAQWLGAPLIAKAPPASSDVILVFGGGVGETGRPGSSTFERSGWAAELYSAGVAGKIVLSSGFMQLSRRDAEDMLRVATADGVAAGDIILEKQAANNYENVRNCLEIMRLNGFSSAVVVTGLYNTLRTRLLFTTQLKAIEVPGATIDSIHLAPSPESVFFHRDSDKLAQLAAVLHEYAAILNYWWKDWI
jgi:uncharacterized SAM-binding protein YcdF (DUF218 family)/glycosyltransferase involved in cell wall biosynthesis